MEPYEELLKRQEVEKVALINRQYDSWQALRAQHGENIPVDAHARWDQQHGNGAKHALEVKHQAERDCWPKNPSEVIRVRSVADERLQVEMEAYLRGQREQEEKNRKGIEAKNNEIKEIKSEMERLAEELAKKSQSPNHGLQPGD